MFWLLYRLPIWFIELTFALLFWVIVRIIIRWYYRLSEKERCLKILKNTLLSHALNIVQVSEPDFDPFHGLSFDYYTMDGSKLPPFSGCNELNAYSTYIRDNTGIATMDRKSLVIQRYLDKHLGTEEQITQFLTKFFDAVRKPPAPQTQEQKERRSKQMDEHNRKSYENEKKRILEKDPEKYDIPDLLHKLDMRLPRVCDDDYIRERAIYVGKIMDEVYEEIKEDKKVEI